MKTWPVLYKLDSKAGLRMWEISVSGADITTRHGMVGGKIQEATETIKSGKNVGRSNETSAEEQAVAEAQSEWDRQVARKGYTSDKSKAEAGENEQAGGIQPMLAQPWEKASRHVKFPCLAQFKIDGVRAIAIRKNGVTTLWSRKCEQIHSMPHVIEAVNRLPGHDITLDGELYCPGMSMQTIASFVRQKNTTKPGFEQIGYYVYDMPSLADTPNHERNLALCALLAKVTAPLVMVTTCDVPDFAAVKTLHDKWVQEGWEGAIVRNPEGRYAVGKRSNDLVKVKEFDTNEFRIVGVREGRGKFEGLAIFTCEIPGHEGGLGATFDCNAPGTLEDRRAFLVQGAENVGKNLTVKHFGFTDDDIPRFPVGVAVRDYE